MGVMFNLECEVCKQCFTHKFGYTKVCSDECRKLKVKDDLGLLKTGLPTQAVGKYHELKVVIDLVEKGYEPYPAMFPQSLCDIVFINRNTNKIVRVEVKTCYRSKSSGSLVGGHCRHDNYDLQALVVRNTNEIIYRDKNKNEVVL